MKQTRLTIEEKPTVQKDIDGYSQLLLNRTNLNNKKSYTFGVTTKYEVENINLLFKNYTNATFVNGNNTPNILTFVGKTITKYEDGTTGPVIAQNIKLDIPMTSISQLSGTYVWHGIPVHYEANYNEGVAKVLYARKKQSGDFEYCVITITSDIDNEMCDNNWTPIAIHAATYDELKYYSDDGIKDNQEGYDLFVALDVFKGDDMTYAPVISGEKFLPFNATNGDITSSDLDVNVEELNFSGFTDFLGSGDTPSNIGIIPSAITEFITDGKVREGNFVYLSEGGLSASSTTFSFSMSTGALKFLIFDGYSDTVELFQKIHLKGIGSADTFDRQTSPENIQIEPSSGNVFYNCPPVAICQNYTTSGTSRGNWYVPGFGELWVALKSNAGQNRKNIDAAIDILSGNSHSCSALKESFTYSSTIIKSGQHHPYGVLGYQDWSSYEETVPYEVPYKYAFAVDRLDDNKVRPFLKAKVASDGITVTEIFKG